MRQLSTAVLLLLLVFSSPSRAGVVFYNPIDEIGERCVNPATMGSFLEELTDAAMALDLQEAFPGSTKALIAVAIWPDRTADLWIDVDGRYLPDASTRLKEELKKLGLPAIRGGPIAFAIHLSLIQTKDFSPVPSEIPQVWKEAAKNQGAELLLPEGVLDLVSPDHASGESFKPFVPPGYEMRSLKATGGSVMAPSDWHFSGGVTNTGFQYIISRERNEDGSYETGFRLVGFVKLRSYNLTPIEAKDQILNSFRESAKRILKECSNESAGFFTRDCLEVIQENATDPETNFRVIHSFLWNEDADMLVVTTFGAPEGEWESVQEVCEIMSEFTLIDLRRLDQNTGSATESSPQ